MANGTHTLTALARDAAGNTTTSAPVTVTVANAATPGTFENEILATGFDLPTAIKFLPDGRMLVAELGGKIKVLPPPYTQADPTPFLQLTNVGSRMTGPSRSRASMTLPWIRTSPPTTSITSPTPRTHPTAIASRASRPMPH